MVAKSRDPLLGRPRSSVRFVRFIFHPCIYRDPVYFPCLSAVVRERFSSTKIAKLWTPSLVVPSIVHLPAEWQGTAARTSPFRCKPFIISLAWRSIDRDVFASRPLLKRRCGSGNDAPLKKLILM